MTSRIGGLFLLMACSFMLSCSSNKGLKKVSKKSLTEVLEGMEDQQVDFDWFTSKGRLSIDSEETSGSVRCDIRMIKDSLVWMNFKKLGFELARTQITADSCHVVYRRDNMYEAGTTEEFLNYYNLYISFLELQHLIIGQFTIPKVDMVTSYDSDKYYNLKFQKDNVDYFYQIKSDFNLHAVGIKDDRGRQVNIQISDYNELGFPDRKELLIFTPEEGEAKMVFKLSGATFNVPKKIPFEIPDYYKKI